MPHFKPGCRNCAFARALPASFDASQLRGLFTCNRFPPTCMEPISDTHDAAVSSVPLVEPDHICGEWTSPKAWQAAIAQQVIAETGGGSNQATGDR